MIGTVENPVVLQQYGTFENNYSMVWLGRWVGVGSSDNKTFSNDKFKNGTGSAVSVTGNIFTENSEWLPKGTPQVDERTDFPIHYWIDYIRLYQKDEYGDLYLA